MLGQVFQVQVLNKNYVNRNRAGESGILQPKSNN